MNEMLSANQMLLQGDYFQPISIHYTEQFAFQTCKVAKSTVRHPLKTF